MIDHASSIRSHLTIIGTCTISEIRWSLGIGISVGVGVEVGVGIDVDVDVGTAHHGNGPAWILQRFESSPYFKFWRDRGARITWACPSVNKIYQRKRFSETFAPSSKPSGLGYLTPAGYVRLCTRARAVNALDRTLLRLSNGGMLLDRKYFTVETLTRIYVIPNAFYPALSPLLLTTSTYSLSFISSLVFFFSFSFSFTLLFPSLCSFSHCWKSTNDHVNLASIITTAWNGLVEFYTFFILWIILYTFLILTNIITSLWNSYYEYDLNFNIKFIETDDTMDFGFRS